MGPVPAPMSSTTAPRGIGASATRASAHWGLSWCHPHGRGPATAADHHEDHDGQESTAVIRMQATSRVPGPHRPQFARRLRHQGATVGAQQRVRRLAMTKVLALAGVAVPPRTRL